jgi:hypothetical protein
MDILQQALRLTKNNMSNITLDSNKRKVAFKEDGKINYLIPGNMKRKSFDNMIDKNVEIISEFENSNKISIKLK